MAIAEKETNIDLAKKKLQEASKLNKNLNIDELKTKANQLAAHTKSDLENPFLMLTGRYGDTGTRGMIQDSGISGVS